MYRSKFEKRIAASLKRKKVKFDYESITLEYSVPVRGTCKQCGSDSVVRRGTYTPDFVFAEHRVLIETKGKFTPQDRTKMLAVIRDNPDWDIRMLFMYDNWLTRAKKVRYSRWCERNNVKYAVGEIPDGWIKEIKT